MSVGGSTWVVSATLGECKCVTAVAVFCGWANNVVLSSTISRILSTFVLSILHVLPSLPLFAWYAYFFSKKHCYSSFLTLDSIVCPEGCWINSAYSVGHWSFIFVMQMAARWTHNIHYTSLMRLLMCLYYFVFIPILRYFCFVMSKCAMQPIMAPTLSLSIWASLYMLTL